MAIHALKATAKKGTSMALKAARVTKSQPDSHHRNASREIEALIFSTGRSRRNRL